MKKIINAIGPALMAIGYTIGTGSVTSMTVAGSRFGMQLLWVLLLSCFFSYVLIDAFGRYYLVTGQTALYAIRKNIKYGKWISLLIIIGITVGQWNSLIGIVGISSNIIFEIINLFIPDALSFKYVIILCVAILILSIFYLILLKGDFTVFEKTLVFFVTFMGLSFLLSMFIDLPTPQEVLTGLKPQIPDVKDGKMIVVAFVGTTMAAATFLTRPLFLKGKGWGVDNLKAQRKDAIWASLLIFIISGAIMAVAATVLFRNGKQVDTVLDMVYVLEPIAGKMAVSIFFLGTLSAGLSSIFPILMISPLLISDFQNGELDIKSKQFKRLAMLACIISMTVPILGANPIQIQILSQVFNVFVLPLVIIGIFILINSASLMKSYKAGFFLNLSILFALIFSLIISYNGIISLIDYFKA